MTIYIDDNFHKELNMKNPIKTQIDKKKKCMKMNNQEKKEEIYQDY
jgi:hypothetical protein